MDAKKMDPKELNTLEGFFADPEILLSARWFDAVTEDEMFSASILTPTNTSVAVIDTTGRLVADYTNGKPINYSNYGSIDSVVRLYGTIIINYIDQPLTELKNKLKTVTNRYYTWLNDQEMEAYNAMKTKIENQALLLSNIKDIVNESVVSVIPGENDTLTTSEQRSDQAQHPDAGVGFYEGSRFFPMTRPISAIWLCCMMAISIFLVLLGLGIFLRFANVEIDIKTPFSSRDTVLSAVSQTPPIQYTTVIGGASLAGIVGAYLYYFLKPRVVKYLKL